MTLSPLRRSICLLSFYLEMCLLLTCVKPQDDFKMSPPNKDGWISPDAAFAPSRPLKSARIDVRPDEWAEKYVECERALRTLVLDGSKEKEKDIETAVSKPPEQCLQEKNGAKAYLQRFVHLLLEASNLNNVEVQPKTWANLKFSISSDQLLTLQKFASEGNVKSIPLRKVDEILGAVLVKPYFSLPEFSFGDVLHKLPSFHIGSFFISVLLPTVWFLSILFLTKNIGKSFIWLIPVIFVTSFMTTATQMFEEVQVEQYLKMKTPNMPQDCRGPYMKWFLGDDECSEVLKAHHLDPNLGITPFKVLSRMCGETMAASMDHFGSGLVGFFANFKEMGFIDRLWAVPLASIVLCTFGVLVFLAITGGTGRLPFFMGSFSFHNSTKTQTDLLGHSDSHPTAAPQQMGALPSTGNITVNINSQVPPNMNELLASISRGVLPRNESDLPSPSTVALQDPLAGGDFVHNFTNQSHLHRSHLGFGSKKIHKQFSQLSSKYKSGCKSSNKLILKRARNLSL